MWRNERIEGDHLKLAGCLPNAQPTLVAVLPDWLRSQQVAGVSVADKLWWVALFSPPMFYQLRQFLRFYFAAVTKYQLHSPFVYDLTMAMLEDDRQFYAFRDVELLRQAALQSEVAAPHTDYGSAGAAASGQALPLRHIVRRAASSAGQGQALFRLANWLQPATVLELGTSVGISTLYLAKGAPHAHLISLEGCAACAEAARTHCAMLHVSHADIVAGPFEETLSVALSRLQRLDLVFVDGNHRRTPTLNYFEQCLPYIQDHTIMVFDDMHSSADMSDAWQHIRQHPRVTCTVDFFDLSLAFFNPDFREKQHWSVIRTVWKPWKIW